LVQLQELFEIPQIKLMSDENGKVFYGDKIMPEITVFPDMKKLTLWIKDK